MDSPDGLGITGPMHDRFDEILTSRALELVGRLRRDFNERRRQLLAARERRAADLADGTLGFLELTRAIREDDTWKVADTAPGLVDRRVGITAPTDRKMTINARDSAARVWLADHEDANTPLRENVVGGQLNLLDAVKDEIDFTSPEGNDVELAGGHRVTRDVVEGIIAEEMAAIRDRVGEEAPAQGRWDDARATFAEMALADEHPDFPHPARLRADAVTPR